MVTAHASEDTSAGQIQARYRSVAPTCHAGVTVRARVSAGLRKWLVRLGATAPFREAGALQAPSYVAAREPAVAFGARLAAEAARRGALEIVRWEGGVTGRGLAILREVGLYGDGAAWIWRLADERFDARIEVVDPYHAYQHLHTAARALFDDTPAASAWVDYRKSELLTSGIDPVLAALRAQAPTPEATVALRVERGYFMTNAERMDYPTLRLDGLSLGSGAIESAADHLVQRRMKRAGMRWSTAGGDALLALKARLRSRRTLAA